MRRHVVLGALLLTGVAALLGATVFRAEVAGAAAAVLQVREQNVDRNGNIKVVAATATASEFRFGDVLSGLSIVPQDTCFSPILASNLVVTAKGGVSGAHVALELGGVCVHEQSRDRYTGGEVVYRVQVAADTTTSIPLVDRLLVDNASLSCVNCEVWFSLLGQAGS